VSIEGPCAGRTVLVTGGSRGIGAATVRALHRDGAHVVVHCGFSRDAADRLVAELGDRASVVCADLTEISSCAAVWEEALAWRGSIDVLVNNAGAWIASPITDADGWAQGWADNLALNLMAPAELCRLAIRHYLSRPEGGVIINVTSRSAHRGDDADHLAYGAAKGGLLALTKGIARGFGARRVLAYAVAPGWVATDLARAADLAGTIAGLPLGELTPPEDVAEVIAFLASGRSPHTTGATIDITGADYVR
jgi:3-oxoacyl-[acyl-carrier protein] reductase